MVRYHSQAEKDNYENNWDGYGAVWHPHMNEMEGKIYKIYESTPHCYRIKDGYEDVEWVFAPDSVVAPYSQF